MVESSLPRDAAAPVDTGRAVIEVVDALQAWFEDRVLLTIAELGAVIAHHSVPILLGGVGAVFALGAGISALIALGLILTRWLPLWAVMVSLATLQLLAAAGLAAAARWSWNAAGRALEVVDE